VAELTELLPSMAVKELVTACGLMTRMGVLSDAAAEELTGLKTAVEHELDGRPTRRL
jgi:hypothetical protein